ncbi:hypothetical protein KA005_56945 [bacterium]|nr:hypothetical protein [bacterium]
MIVLNNIQLERARERLAMAAAHFVVDGIWEVPVIVDEINKRLAAGEKP